MCASTPVATGVEDWISAVRPCLPIACESCDSASTLGAVIFMSTVCSRKLNASMLVFGTLATPAPSACMACRKYCGPTADLRMRSSRASICRRGSCRIFRGHRRGEYVARYPHRVPRFARLAGCSSSACAPTCTTSSTAASAAATRHWRQPGAVIGFGGELALQQIHGLRAVSSRASQGNGPSASSWIFSDSNCSMRPSNSSCTRSQSSRGHIQDGALRNLRLPPPPQGSGMTPAMTSASVTGVSSTANGSMPGTAHREARLLQP